MFKFKKLDEQRNTKVGWSHLVGILLPLVLFAGLYNVIDETLCSIFLLVLIGQELKVIINFVIARVSTTTTTNTNNKTTRLFCLERGFRNSGNSKFT